jgi:hypothetical protein
LKSCEQNIEVVAKLRGRRLVTRPARAVSRSAKELAVGVPKPGD